MLAGVNKARRVRNGRDAARVVARVIASVLFPCSTRFGISSSATLSVHCWRPTNLLVVSGGLRRQVWALVLATVGGPILFQRMLRLKGGAEPQPNPIWAMFKRFQGGDQEAPALPSHPAEA
eukprot:1180024-Prorocentrum_minimum.AAC.1